MTTWISLVFARSESEIIFLNGYNYFSILFITSSNRFNSYNSHGYSLSSVQFSSVLILGLNLYFSIHFDLFIYLWFWFRFWFTAGIITLPVTLQYSGTVYIILLYIRFYKDLNIYSNINKGAPQLVVKWKLPGFTALLDWSTRLIN